MMPLQDEIACKLLEIEAVFLRPNDLFTWASGIKSPIYCDNRMTMSYPEVRRMICDGFADLVKKHFSDVEVLAGTATAGIPHAAWLAEKLDLPMAYIRSSSKGHGRTNRIEGKLEPGQKVLIIEDLISTGGSSLNAVEAVKEAGGEVLGVLAIFTYQLDKALQAFEKEEVKLYTLSNYDTLISVALEKKLIKQEDMEFLQNWKSQV